MDMTVLGDKVRLNGHSGFITGERDGRWACARRPCSLGEWVSRM